jgi:HAD hydrolase, family IA, variant 3
MKKGAIFDMDGLLFDTETVYQRGWTIIADEFGVERKPGLGKACCGTCGDLTLRLVNEFHPTVDAEAYVRRVIEYVHDEAAKNLPVMEGAREILQYFHEHGVRIATASSSTVAQIEANLIKSDLRDYFDAVVGGDLVANGKPAPDIFLLAAERIDVPPVDCYVFEDGYNGLRGAATAGCAPVMIPDTMLPTDEMRTICTGVYPSLSAALDAIRQGML